MKTDHIFYALFRTAPEIVLKLIGQLPSHGYEFSSVEVKETAFRLDGVLTPKVESAEQPTIFVEVQFQKDDAFYRRLFAEIFMFLRHNPEVTYWRSVIIFERRSREPEDAQKVPFQTLLNSSQVHRIYLEDFQQTESTSLEAAILQLVVTKPRSTIQRAKALINTVNAQSDSSLPNSQILGLIETIVLCKFPNLDREEIAAMLGIDELKQTRVYKDALEEGRQEGEYSIVLKQLTYRLGELPQSAERSVRSLTAQQLENLSYRLLDIATIEELDEYLASI